MIPGLARRHTVIAPDLLGHGASDKPRADYAVAAYTNGVRDLLGVLGIERATLVGHSLGGGRGRGAGGQPRAVPSSARSERWSTGAARSSRCWTAATWPRACPRSCCGAHGTASYPCTTPTAPTRLCPEPPGDLRGRRPLPLPHRPGPLPRPRGGLHAHHGPCRLESGTLARTYACRPPGQHGGGAGPRVRPRGGPRSAGGERAQRHLRAHAVPWAGAEPAPPRA
ncbi:alpha/beta fold hydrolase [Streptomyces atroolivaceus]|uniref:alpha/beta fold hydrolase n=1 Tax=Streptomyces atroolivaceus TaxID=66869 RepID=UPI003442F603